ATDGEDDDVGVFRDLYCFGDLRAIFGGIAGHDFILLPRAADGNFAAFGVADFGAIADVGFNTVEHGDVVFRLATVSTVETAICVRANDGNLAQFLDVERHDVAVVLEQRHRFARGFQRQFAIRL